MAKYEDFEPEMIKKEKVPVNDTWISKGTLSESIPQSYYSQSVYRETPQTINLSVLQENLGNCLKIIDDEVMKGYITRLSSLPVVKPDYNRIESMNAAHFFKITELVYQEDEFSVHNLATVFHALSNKPCTLVLMIRSDGEKNEFYLGTRAGEGYSSGTMMQMLRQSLLGLFPGSQIDNYYDNDMKEDMKQLKTGCISSVTCVADYKQEEDAVNNKDFVQGLEKFIYSMQGKAYTAVFIADNLSHDDVMRTRRDYENIYTQIAPFANMQLNFTMSNSDSTSDGQSYGETRNVNYGLNRGTTESIGGSHTKTNGRNDTHGTTDTRGKSKSTSDGTTHTDGYSDGTSYSESDSHTEGKSMSVGIGSSVPRIMKPAVNVNASIGTFSSDTHTVTHGSSHTDSVSDSVSKTLTHGISESSSDSITHGTNESDSDTATYGTGISQGESYGVGAAFNLVDTKTLTNTFGTSQGITLNAQNMTLSSMLQRIEKQLQRMDECESLGMWNFAAYFLGESAAETETAANTYQSVVSGIESGIECSAVNTWTDEESLERLSGYVKHFLHPRFLYSGFSYDGDRMVEVNPSAMVSTNELAIHMGLPRHSVKGLPVIEHAIFAQEVLQRKEASGNHINLGKVYHVGKSTPTDVGLDIKSLAMHTFITGSTGSGKSNAVYHMLDEASSQGIPFLVVEPAKGEYRKVFRNVRCFGTNPGLGELIRINPFSFPKEIHVLEHIDRIIEIFNVCWPMYAAMPAVLKDSIERAYVVAGWDLDLSVNTKIEGLYPTFEDVLTELYNVINSSAYSSDTKGDYIGSLSTRIKSLTNGINGRIFVGNEIDLKDLFDKSAILDISRVGSMETKALIMGLVVLKLQEYRMSHATEMNVGLKHLTVLEEAHNLLKKTSTQQSQDSSNLQGKSVEMLTNAIAEIRTYGEGFIIVDQAPDLLDTAAIRNTNTKIVLRLPEGNDREITGEAMALKDNQIDELSKLPTGVAAVYQNDWQEAVLCQLPKYEMRDMEQDGINESTSVISRKQKENAILHKLLKNTYDADELVWLKQAVLETNSSAKIRRDIIMNLETRNNFFEWAVADFINKNYNLSQVFQRTDNSWKSLEQLSEVMMSNLKAEFEEFSREEMLGILYYVCRIQHERFPENKVIEQLRVDYLKKQVMHRK